MTAEGKRTRDEDYTDALNVEGIEIFDMPGNLPGAAGQSPVSDLVPLTEAMVRLNLSERTIRRRLKTGALQAIKDATGRLLINCQALPGNSPDIARQVPATACQPSESEKLWQWLEDYKQQVNEQAAKIETLRARNGYLEAQLENKTLLLEDRSRHWWQRIWQSLSGK